MRVVVADSNQGFRAFLRHLLESQKDIKVVDEALDGEEALRKTFDHQPELVLVDIELPRYDGLETTRRIKNALPRTGVIILSNLDSGAFRDAAFRWGADDFLHKLASISKMLATMRGLGGRRTAAGEKGIIKAGTGNGKCNQVSKEKSNDLVSGS